MATRPSKVRIAGREWRFRWRSADAMYKASKAVGLTHYGPAIMDIATGQPAFATRDTVLHELFHAILAQVGHSRNGDEVEEALVGPLATGLVGVLQDNPEFARWLTEKLP